MTPKAPRPESEVNDLPVSDSTCGWKARRRSYNLLNSKHPTVVPQILLCFHSGSQFFAKVPQFICPGASRRPERKDPAGPGGHVGGPQLKKLFVFQVAEELTHLLHLTHLSLDNVSLLAS